MGLAFARWLALDASPLPEAFGATASALAPVPPAKRDLPPLVGLGLEDLRLAAAFGAAAAASALVPVPRTRRGSLSLVGIALVEPPTVAFP